MPEQEDSWSSGAAGDAAWSSVQTRTYADSVLSPLDPEEAAVAVREALAAVTRGRDVSPERMMAFRPQLRIEKPVQRDGAPTRLVLVRVRDRDRRVVHDVSVTGGAVTDHVVGEHGSPPFSDEERDHARRLLSAEPSLERVLAGDDVEIEWFHPGHGSERLLGARLLKVRDGQVVELVAQAVADLDRETVAGGGDRDE